MSSCASQLRLAMRLLGSPPTRLTCGRASTQSELRRARSKSRPSCALSWAAHRSTLRPLLRWCSPVATLTARAMRPRSSPSFLQTTYAKPMLSGVRHRPVMVPRRRPPPPPEALQMHLLLQRFLCLGQHLRRLPLGLLLALACAPSLLRARGADPRSMSEVRLLIRCAGYLRLPSCPPHLRHPGALVQLQARSRRESRTLSSQKMTRILSSQRIAFPVWLPLSLQPKSP